MIFETCSKVKKGLIASTTTQESLQGAKSLFSAPYLCDVPPAVIITLIFIVHLCRAVGTVILHLRCSGIALCAGIFSLRESDIALRAVIFSLRESDIAFRAAIFSLRESDITLRAVIFSLRESDIAALPQFSGVG